MTSQKADEREKAYKFIHVHTGENRCGTAPNPSAMAFRCLHTILGYRKNGGSEHAPEQVTVAIQAVEKREEEAWLSERGLVI